MIIRDARESDAQALAAIYGHHVLNGLGTFEETPPSAEQMGERLETVRGYGLPYLVAEDHGEILGFAYAGPFRTRSAYRYTVEDSVYVRHDAVGRGVGRALLSAILINCEAMGVRQVVAVIGDSENEASLALHRSQGFLPAGLGKGFGYKHGRWVDIVWMHRPLNDGDASPPEVPGLNLG